MPITISTAYNNKITYHTSILESHFKQRSVYISEKLALEWQDHNDCVFSKVLELFYKLRSCYLSNCSSYESLNLIQESIFLKSFCFKEALSEYIVCWTREYNYSPVYACRVFLRDDGKMDFSLIMEKTYFFIYRRINKMNGNLVGNEKPTGGNTDFDPINCCNNSLSHIIPDKQKGGLGFQIAQLRFLLGQTQSNFAKLLLTTRQSIVALERCKNADELSDGLLFRTYYLANEVSTNACASVMQINVSKEILITIKECIEEKVNK